MSGGRVLWFDPAKLEYRDLGKPGGPLFVGANRLWAGQSVFDEASSEFVSISHGNQQWHLVGATAREIWADVYVDDELRHRPALVDTAKLTVRVLPVTNAAHGKPLLINEDFTILAEDEQRVWLSGGGVNVEYDRGHGELRTVSAPDLETKETKPPQGPEVIRQIGAGSVVRWYLGSQTLRSTAGPTLSGDRGPACVWFERGPTLLLGASIVREWGEDNLGSDDGSGMSHHVQDLEGGVFRIDLNSGQWTKLGDPTDELSDFYVKRIVFDSPRKRAYLCTNGGVTILSLPDCAIIGRLTVSDGLPSNKVEDVVRIGQCLYLACELGDDGGGLAVVDLDTGLVQTLSAADGLKCNKIKALRADGAKLQIIYGWMYGPRSRHGHDPKAVHDPSDDHVITYTSSILETQTGHLSDGGETLPSPIYLANPQPVPYLGGTVLMDVTHGGKRFIGGTHGLAILDNPSITLASSVETQNVTRLLSVRQQQLSDAEARRPTIRTVEDLAKALQEPNPYYRANVVHSDFVSQNIDQCMDLIAGRLADPELRVRCTALVQVIRSKPDDRVVRLLRERLEDPDPNVRAVATITLVKLGHLPDIKYLREILEHERHRDDHTYGGFPFGATSSVGVLVSKEGLWDALAQYASAEHFELFLEDPVTADSYEPRQKIIAKLGESLRQHPEAAPILLRVTAESSYNQGHIQSIQAVFKVAGASLLPVLNEALTSSNRIVRSNAARACGAIGDSTSVPQLIKALDLESGLARASIVWALGELKATNALPHLAKLYVDASNDEKRQRGAGFRMAQSGAVMQAQYESLRNLDVINRDWDELKAASLKRPSDPRQDEELLNPHDIMEAVRKIGPAASQDFYRNLAGSADGAARCEAAVALADATPADREVNLPILRNLLADTYGPVRMRTAVSLLILGHDVAQRPILEWLSAANEGDKRQMLEQLARVTEGARLTFARQPITRLAADQTLHESIRQIAQSLLSRLPADRDTR
jgi:HEAT repeat protein